MICGATLAMALRGNVCAAWPLQKRHVCVSDLWRSSCVGVWRILLAFGRGGVCVNDLWRAPQVFTFARKVSV